MKADYTKYRISGGRGPQEIIGKGEIELPENGHGRRFNLRRAFPGFDISSRTAGGEDLRMHNADWTVGIAVTMK